jgi:PAS domain S-box-containing protein
MAGDHLGALREQMADNRAESNHLTDAEARKLAEARLEESLRRVRLERNRLQTVLDTIPSGLIVVEGPDARITFMNKRTQEFFGTPPEIGKPLPAYLASSKLLRPDGRPFTPEELPISRSLTSGEEIRGEEMIVETQGGQRSYLLLGSAPLYDESGHIYGAVASTEDITPLREAQQALREAYARERRVSETLQQALLPAIPERLNGLRLASAYKAALEEAQIGGDFFDLFSPSPGLVGLVIGDVAGKGVDAAVRTALTRHSLKAYAYLNPSPAVVMEALNGVIVREMIPESFVTVFYGLLDVRQRTLNYANAGHEPPLCLLPHTGEVGTLLNTGIPLGVRNDATYDERSISLPEGSRLLLYTDGVTEARSRQGLFGLDRLKEFLLSRSQEPPMEFVNHLVECIQEFSYPHLRDDIAILLAETTGSGREEPVAVPLG